MSAAKLVTITRPEARIAVVAFDRTDGINALSPALMKDLTAAIDGLSDDPDVSAVILTGSAKVFSKGMDLKAPELAGLNQKRLSERRRIMAAGPRMCRAWADAGPLTIAAVEGWCIGGGLALAAMCDLRVAGLGATFYAPEIERGMNMAWGSVPRITGLIGPARAKRLLVLAERVGAGLAESWGLVDAVCDDGTAVDGALALARRAAALPPVPVRMIKAGIDAAAWPLADAVSRMDGDQHLLAWTSDDFAEGMQSFLDRRPPKYTGG